MKWSQGLNENKACQIPSFIEYLLLLLLLDTRKSNKPMLPVPNRSSVNVYRYPFTSGIWKREFLFALSPYYESRLFALPLQS